MMSGDKVGVVLLLDILKIKHYDQNPRENFFLTIICDIS